MQNNTDRQNVPTSTAALKYADLLEAQLLQRRVEMACLRRKLAELEKLDAEDSQEYAQLKSA